MTNEQKNEIIKLVNDSLDSAESVWEEVGATIMAKAAFANESRAILNRRDEPVPTRIPGHEFIEDGKPLVDEFIAFVLDMRDSSKHLNMAITDTNASELKRVYYETAAVLPACSRIVANNQGGVTEYLGDGMLAFFRAEKDIRDEACYHAHAASVECIDSVKSIINPILKDRYRLPPIQIGVGMAFSKAILTITGEGNFHKPTAFGKCVFYATKLSKGNDKVYVDEALKIVWPKSDSGPVRFLASNMNGVSGFIMYSV